MATLLTLALLGLIVGSSCGSSLTFCDVTAPPFNARCDDATDDAPSIQRALDDATCGTVVIPSTGKPCVSRALNVTLMGGRTLRVEGELAIWRDPATYKGRYAHNNMFLSATSGDGSWTGSLLTGFTLTGGGRLVGNGAAWWPSSQSLVRPRFLWLPNCSHIEVSNLTLIDSPAWNLGLRGDDIVVHDMTIVAGGLDKCAGFGFAPNTDGINIGGHRITIMDTTIHNGDDCVPTTTGPDGSTSDVLVQRVHCACGTNGGVLFNEGGTIRDVLFTDMTVTGTNQGAGVKLSRPGRDASGGLVSNVTWRNVVITTPRYAAMYVNVYQEDAQPPCVLPPKPDLKDWLTVRDIHFENITATVYKGQEAGCFRCTPGTPCEGFTFDGVRVLEEGGAVARPYACFNVVRSTQSGGSEPHACAA